jgi:chromosome segregation ATPase
MARPLPDPLEKWRAEAEAHERQREAARSEIAAETARNRDAQNVAAIEEIVRAAVLAERAFLSEVIAGVLAEAIGRLDQEIKEKRDALASDLRELRRDIAGINRALAEVREIDRERERRGGVVDLPNPLRRVN